MNKTLLHQIQDEAVSSNHDLSPLLRKCRVLAQRLDSEDLKLWVTRELDGYPNEDSLPDYRILDEALLIGDYFGPAGSQLRNVQIPITAIHEKLRDSLISVKFLQGISQIHELTAHAEKGCIKISVPPEVIPLIGTTHVNPAFALGSVVKIVNTSFLQGILDTVRNRILNFTLELESEAPRTGDPLDALRTDKSDRVQQIFNTEIKGNVGNIAQGGTHFSQNASVGSGDRAALRSALESIGIEDALCDEIVEAANSETPSENGGFGKRVSDLIGKVVAAASRGALKVSGTVAANLITEWLKGYYNL